MEANTRNVSCIIADKYFTEELIKNEKEKRIEELAEKLTEKAIEFDEFISKNEWVKIENKKMYYVNSENIFIPDIKEIAFSRCDKPFEKKFEGFEGELISYYQAYHLFKTNWGKNPFRDKDHTYNYFSKRANGDLCSSNYIRYRDNNDNNSSGTLDLYYNKTSCSQSEKYWYKNCNSCSGGCNKCVRIPVINLEEKFVFKSFGKYNVMPVGISDQLRKYLEIYSEYKNYILDAEGEEKSFVMSDKFYEDVMNDKIDSIDDVSFKTAEILKYISSNEIELSGELENIFKEKYLNCDNVRADIEPYKEDCLNDPNLGHWELWKSEAGEDEIKVNINRNFYGRNPVADVKYDGIVGIDFGTKSTIVAFQNGNDKTRLMRIGSGNFNKEIKPEDYENPTVCEFININEFTQRYQADKGRPFTKWEDLTVSHTARESLFSTARDNSQYYSFFSDIKQWCSSKDRTIIIKDKNEQEIELAPFVSLNDNDFNPVEIYAYYLGLYINNMYNGIYIDYRLSFPVTYEKEIRKKIIKSFDAGLKKSLPKEILDDESIMKRFRVMQGTSEPASYAVCALEQYGFDEIEDDEKVFYGIFDFGGGTTDFDFGIWRCADENDGDRYEYVIHHFGAGGDRCLGGEYILEMLAFEVFKKNEKLLRDNNIKFSKPEECEAFAGSEVLLSESQEAKLNIKQLMEDLRPLWEKTDGYEKIYENNELKCSALFDNNGGRVSGISLQIDVDELNDLIKKRIEKGVRNFFDALSDALTEEIAKEQEEIIIFLAGNSSKSEFVEDLFNKYTKIYSDKLKEKYTFKNAEATVNKEDMSTRIKNFLEENDIGDAMDEDIDSLILLLRQYNETNEDEEISEFLDFLYGYLYDDKNEYIDDNIEKIVDAFEKISNIYKTIEGISDNIKSILDDIAEEKENNLFNIYPPLGTEEAKEIQKLFEIDNDFDEIMRPTGKTGVAYGLIESRNGSGIKVISEVGSEDEIKFNYFLGHSKRKKFKPVIDRNIEYKKWVKFIDATEYDFEIYYTALPEASSGSMPINGVAKKRCSIDETNDDAFVYIRVVEPSAVEFVVALPDEIDDEDYITEIKKVTLG